MATQPDPRQRPITGLSQIVNPQPQGNIIGYDAWNAKYGGANGTPQHPAVGYAQMIAENPGLTEPLINLYSTRMRGEYNNGLMNSGAIPSGSIAPYGPESLTGMTDYYNLSNQGYNLPSLLGMPQLNQAQQKTDWWGNAPQAQSQPTLSGVLQQTQQVPPIQNRRIPERNTYMGLRGIFGNSGY